MHPYQSIKKVAHYDKSVKVGVRTILSYLIALHQVSLQNLLMRMKRYSVMVISEEIDRDYETAR